MRERMSSVDGAWFRMDRPENTADVVSLLTFRELPPVAHIRKVVEERLLACPRFRQRVIPGIGVGADSWEDDPAFSLDHHLVRHHLRSRDPRALRELVSEIATEPLDPARPLWRACLVEGPTSGAIVSKLHHCIGDGFALVALLLTLADEPPEAPGAPRQLVEAYRRLAPWLEPGGLVAEVLRGPSGALGLGASAAALAAAVIRMSLLSRDPPTLLSRPLTGRRRVAWSHGLPLEPVRDAARGHGATVNDLVLAGVAGALRSCLSPSAHKMGGAALRAMIPVNLRPGPPDPTTGLGNRFGLVYLDLPTELRSPHARLDAVRERTAELKRRPDAVASMGVLGAIGSFPPIVHWASAFFAQKASLVVTNVPGPRRPLHVAGRRVENAMFWVPHPSTLGMGISVLTYAGEMRIGVRSDEAVLSAPEALVEAFERELVRLGAALPTRSRTARRPAVRRRAGHRATHAERPAV